MSIEVPRRQQGTVATAPLPGARLSPDAPSAAFQPPTPIDLTGANRSIQEYVQREAQKADQLAVLDADNQLATLSTDLETQARALKGKDSLNAQATVDTGFKKGVDQIRQSLVNDRQRLAFEGRVAQRRQSLYEQVARHTEVETQHYDDQTTQVGLDQRLSDAVKNYQDPAQLARAIGETKAILADYGRRNGWDKDVIAARVAERVSKVHTGVIDRMLAQGNDLAASKYYAAVKGELTGIDTGPIEKALEEGSVRGESQRQADQIMSANPTRTVARDQAAKITDPKVREAVETRIHNAFAENDAAERDTREANMLTATNLVDKTSSIYSIPPALWTSFTLNERAALKEYAKQKVKGDPIETNWTVYYDLLSLASSDATKDDFLSKNLLQYRAKLGDTEFKQVAELQAGLRRGDAKADAQLVGIRTRDKILTASLNAVGIDPTPKQGTRDAERVSDFGRAVDEQGILFEQQHKRKPNAKELQGIVDDLLIQGTIAGTGIFGLFQTHKREFERVPGEGDFVVDAKDVPPAERLKIEEALKRNKQPVTDANVLRLYLQKLSTLVPSASQ